MTRAVLLTGHFPEQHRKPSMLWISEHLQRMGWHVTHVTVGYSWLSRLKRDKRLRALPHRPRPGTRFRSETLTSVFGYSPLHPVSLRADWLDRLAAPLHRVFPAWWAPRLAPHLARADLVILESGTPVMLAPLVHHLAPEARRIYRVNDDLAVLGAPAFLRDAEARIGTHVDRISTASPHLARRFAGARVTLDPMGIPHDALRGPFPDPYGTRTPFEAICAGTTQIDLAALRHIAEARPQWRLHVLGALKQVPELPRNVVLHGEVKFDRTVGFISHADIGLAPYRDIPGAEYQSHNSNRMLLYRHFGLPILGPDRLCHPSLPSFIGYSDRHVWFRCETRGKRPEPLPDWADLARSLADQNPCTDPPFEAEMLPETA